MWMPPLGCWRYKHGSWLHASSSPEEGLWWWFSYLDLQCLFTFWFLMNICKTNDASGLSKLSNSASNIYSLSFSLSVHFISCVHSAVRGFLSVLLEFVSEDQVMPEQAFHLLSWLMCLVTVWLSKKEQHWWCNFPAGLLVTYWSMAVFPRESPDPPIEASANSLTLNVIRRHFVELFFFSFTET